MNTITVWLLISISNGGFNSGYNSSGVVTVVARFHDSAQCQSVQRSIKEMSERVATRCIQAVIVKD